VFPGVATLIDREWDDGHVRVRPGSERDGVHAVVVAALVGLADGDARGGEQPDDPAGDRREPGAGYRVLPEPCRFTEPSARLGRAVGEEGAERSVCTPSRRDRQLNPATARGV
jgi:hypothetical protein